MPTLATQQEPFCVRAKIELVRRRITVKQLAAAIGKSRTAVSQSINHGLHRETRKLIANYLKIAA